MKIEHALRYLILRYLCKFKRKLKKKHFVEIANTLKVRTRNSERYVNWFSKKQKHSLNLNSNHFEFYKRGDIDPNKRTFFDSLQTNNRKEAILICQKIIKLSNKK